MPIVSVGRNQLFHELGRSFTQEEFEDLCFNFGIELDDVTSEAEIAEKMKGATAAQGLSTEIIYKIDIPANRYDLLCIEGLSRALKVFLCSDAPPSYSVTNSPSVSISVSTATKSVRPFLVAAVLRGIQFTPQSYQSFIDLQDKLHQNICRERSLVAIGTHDLDTIKAPFRYDALPGDQIKFQALKEDQVMTCHQLFQHYKEKPQCEVRKYLPLIEKSPVYPVIYDANNNVLSVPPIINSHLSRITLNTTNVFIECTATDLTKAHIVLNTMVCMFSEYTSPTQYQCEPVDIRYDGDKDSNCITPDLSTVHMKTTASYINKGIGIDIPASAMVSLLQRMQIKAELTGSDEISVSIPPTRSDILHPCDILEDVAIAYGFNNIARTIPKCYTMAKQQPIGSLSDHIREGVAQAGFTEVLTWALISRAETYDFMLQPDQNQAVIIGNPKTAEFQMVRLSLIPGILKTLSYNRASVQLPVKLFELSDVAMCDDSNPVGARNDRRLSAVYCARSAGFDVIHGLLDRIMTLNRVRHSDSKCESSSGKGPIGHYCIRRSNNPSFLPHLRADIMFQRSDANNAICLGSMGVLHPQVLHHFSLDSPCSALEISIEPLLEAGRLSPVPVDSRS